MDATDPAANAPPQPSPLDQIAQALGAQEQALQHLTERLNATDAYQQQADSDVAQRFESMRAAFAELRAKVNEVGGSSYKDDQRRRLVEFVGYEPTPEQQMQLFTAFAGWHATEPRLVENRQAEYQTKKGGTISYGYADLAGVIATGQSAAPFGLCALTRQELDDGGTPVVTGYLMHSGGGCISSGPVPLFIGDSERRGQAHAAGLTTCRRLALQMVLGLAAERDDDFNAGAETQPRQARQQGGPSGPQGQQQPTRTVTTGRQQSGGAARQAPTRQGPPPGWLSKEQRLTLEQEMMDPAITPERFQEIEAKLLAAAAAPSPQQQNRS